jgi:hypothetical protein
MSDGTGANRDEIDRVIAALTDGELLKLRHFAAFRVRGLGRASCGRTWEDLLGEAKLATLKGAANNGTGRRWKGDVDLVTHLRGAMRSISSHWKRDFDEQEADLESELRTHIEEEGTGSALDNAASHRPSPERELAAREQWNLIVKRCQGDHAATQVLDGVSLELSASEIMHDYGFTKWEYQQAMKRIRLSSDIDHLRIARIQARRPEL